MDSTKTYRFVLKDSGGVTIWTQDGIPGSGSGALSGAQLWTQNGSTVYNSTGNRVCIGATACTAALATLNVAGTTSGSTYPLRIDDTASNPGIGLYGAGAALGYYTANSSGLQLRAADNSSQVSVTNGNVQVFNSAASGNTTLNVKISATQGSNKPFQILNSSGTALTYVDQLGRIIALGTDSGNDTIDVPNGGITAKYLVGLNSLFLTEIALPTELSDTNQARIVANSADDSLYMSINGGAYTQIGGGGGGSTTFNLVGAGTNTHALVMGAGGTLTVAGGGTINATSITSTSVPASPAADMLLITTAAGVGAWSGASLNTTGLANCTDTGGNHLNYHTSTHEFSCGTSGGTVGSVSFSAITGSTNSSSAMVVGTGSSLVTSGTGTISATQINLAAPPASGSIWKSNGSLQAVAATATDIVAAFSSCSGIQYLGADGACHNASGGGSFLPLAGGTMTGSITANTTADIGSTSAGLYFNNGYFGGIVEGARMRMFKGTPAAASSYFDLMSNPSNDNILELRDASANVLLQVDNTRVFSAFASFGFDGRVIPQRSSTHDLGLSSTPWRSLYLSNNLVMGGTTRIDNLGFGLLQSLNVLQNVTVNSGGVGSTILSATEWQPQNSNTVSLGDSTHYFGISYFRSVNLTDGTYTTSIGPTAAIIPFTVLLGNAASSTVVIGSSSASTVAFGGGAVITPPSGAASLNGVQSCPGGQHVASVTYSWGFATSQTCN